MQRSWWIVWGCFRSPVMAPTGQAATQTWQPLHARCPALVPRRFPFDPALPMLRPGWPWPSCTIS